MLPAHIESARLWLEAALADAEDAADRKEADRLARELAEFREANPLVDGSVDVG